MAASFITYRWNSWKVDTMDRAIRYAAYLANLLMLAGVCFIFIGAYGRDAYIALLLAIPPVLSIIALYCGPDIEERRLARKVNKARMNQELESFTDSPPLQNENSQ